MREHVCTSITSLSSLIFTPLLDAIAFVFIENLMNYQGEGNTCNKWESEA